MADDSRVLTVLVADSVLFGFLALFLVVRLWVRFGILRSFDWDDGALSYSKRHSFCMLILEFSSTGLREFGMY